MSKMPMRYSISRLELTLFLSEARRTRWLLSPLALCSLALSFCGLPSAAHAQSPNSSAASGPVDFVRDIQPLFAQQCNGCHGPKSQLGALRLDAKSLAFRGGQSGHAGIVPGKPEDSTLYQRIAGLTDQARMPMGGKPLDAAIVAKVKRWILDGAVWPDTASAQAAEIKKHWAFLPPQRPAVPAVAKGLRTLNPIDNFVLARLAKEGLSPSPEADRATLVRRLHLDLVGLPPTPKQVDDFVSDKRPDAYARLVDSLLASPHYGEKWGRAWLDAARYADSDGFEKDKQRSVWFYRDWVVRALNADKPYDQFLTEQLAGDLLPNPTQDNLVATGFLRNSMINEEGGADPEQFRMEAMFDRMDAIGKAMLGVTIQCAQCHNHKFDPLTQEEYYKLFAYLNQTNEGSIVVYTPAEEQQRATIYQRTKELEEAYQHQHPDWQQQVMAWAKQTGARQPAWTVPTFTVDDISTGGAKYLPQGDGSWLQQGYAPTKHRVWMTAQMPAAATVGSLQVELLTDLNLPMQGPGRSIEGMGALTEFEVEISRAADPKKREKIKVASALADFEMSPTPIKPYYWDKTDNSKRLLGPVSFAIDGLKETAWGIDAGPGRRNVPRRAVFHLEKAVSLAPGDQLHVYLRQDHGGWNSDDNQNNNLGRIRISYAAVTDAPVDPVSVALRQQLQNEMAQLSPAQQQSLFRAWRSAKENRDLPGLAELNRNLEDLWKQHPEGTSQLVLSMQENLRKTNILVRGDFLKPGKEVKPGTPAFLHPQDPGLPPNRLGLAKWLTSKQSPTVARSIVNRIWQAYFGQGIVISSEDLGKQSDAPSHPELLDWLATDLMDKGWSLKQLHRTIVMSATYRQSSKAREDLLAADPQNRLLGRAPRLRVEAETVRDITLAASGLLNAKLGGPPVYPPAPDFLFLPPSSYGPKVWKEEKGADRYRRALYTHRYRSVPYPMLTNFDAPNGDIACVRRTRSNTPLQALTALNEPLFLEAARALAKKTLAEGGKSNRDRATFAFRQVLGRKPMAEELTELLALLEKQTRRFAAGELQPQAMLGPGWSVPNAPEAAGWTVVSRVLLNLDEAITKE